MAVLLYRAQQRLYPTPYQWNKVGITVGISLGILAIYFLLEPGLWIRLALIVAFIGLHFLFGFIKPDELKYIKALFRRSRQGTK